MRTFAATLVIVGSLSMLGSSARADDPATIVLPPQHIVGRRQGPGVVPILGRARFHYRAPDLDRRATDAIVHSVDRPPF